MQPSIFDPKCPHSTHFPLLKYLLEQSNGFVIEIGSGYSSTPLCYEIAHQKNGFCLSLENDKFFYNKFLVDNDANFKIESVKEWVSHFQSPEMVDLPKSRDWFVCLVDNAPWVARLTAIEYVKNFVPYILLHDCDFYTREKLVDDWGKYFKYYRIYNVHSKPYKSGPPTLLGSNLVENLEFKIEGMYIEP